MVIPEILGRRAAFLYPVGSALDTGQEGDSGVSPWCLGSPWGVGQALCLYKTYLSPDQLCRKRSAFMSPDQNSFRQLLPRMIFKMPASPKGIFKSCLILRHASISCVEKEFGLDFSECPLQKHC